MTQSSRRIQHMVDWLNMPIFPEMGFDPIRDPFVLAEHSHPYFELTCVSSGHATWVLPDQALPLVGGSFALTQPNVEHRGEWNMISPCNLFWLHIDLTRPARHTVFDRRDLADFQQALQGAGNTTGRTSAGFNRLLAQWEQVLRQSSKNTSTAFVASARALLCQLLATLVEEIRGGCRNAGPSREALLMEQFLQAHVEEDIALADLVGRAGLSPRSVIKHFKQAFGQTPIDYLRRLRCQRATEYLRQTNRSITDIAFTLGFRSSQNFAKVFRRYTNMTPGEYRRLTVGERRE